MHVTHVYDQVGTYQAALTVEDGRGGVDTATAQVTVTAPPEMDLQPITMDVSAVLVDPQTLEMTGTVEIEIRNNGTTYIADSYELALYEDTNMNQILDADTDQLLGSSTIPHGPAGGNSITVSVDITGTALFAGNLIYVFVDSDNQIKETNEDNNITHSMADCEYVPPVGSFDPVLEWEWTGSTINPSSNQVMCAPVVANLTDDNGDGIVNQSDVPDRSRF
jgi:PKD repeat protein